MPDRILRAGLFDSDAWLALKNNDDRVCYIALFEHADNLGNQPAGALRLMRYWRPYGIDTSEKVAKVLSELSDVDLVRPYQVEQKPFVAILKFRQSIRYPGRLFPPPPWATDQEKQLFAKKSRAIHGDSPVGVGVGVRVGVNQNRTSPVLPVDKSAPVTVGKPQTWKEHWNAKGKAFGMNPNPGESDVEYCKRVIARAKTA